MAKNKNNILSELAQNWEKQSDNFVIAQEEALSLLRTLQGLGEALAELKAAVAQNQSEAEQEIDALSAKVDGLQGSLEAVKPVNPEAKTERKAFPESGDTVELFDPLFAEEEETEVSTAAAGMIIYRFGKVTLPYEQAKELYENLPNLRLA
ncbi:MAG: hypothetical protein AAF975_00625 [Spirochaetota bacterium]